MDPSHFQSPQAGRERTALLPPLEGKFTHQTRKGQVQMHQGARTWHSLVFYILSKERHRDRVYAEGVLVPYPPQLARISIGSWRGPLVVTMMILRPVSYSCW